MDISLHHTKLSVRTAFNEESDLIQIFSGMKSGNLDYNDPIDFRMAGLQRKGHCDIWHVDTVLASPTDEAAPVMILSDWMGSNHGYSCAVRAYIPGHDKTYADIGSLWEDQTGMQWTLLRIESETQLLFLSQNIGVSEEHFHFADRIEGTLDFVKAGVHPTAIEVESQQGNVQLTRAYRHLRRELYYWKDGKKYEISGYHVGCDRVEMIEEYEIINPATVAEALRNARPAEGYVAPQDLAVGTPIFRYKITFYIENDGTVICEFDHKLLQDVYWNKCFGIMYQEKCDIYNKGVWRYIPKLRTIIDADGEEYDFSSPYNTSGTKFPKLYNLTPDTWEKPDSPPDRQIDFIRGPGGAEFTEGDSVVGFAGGYLPIYDGEPGIRKGNIEEAAMLIGTRKTYPSFVTAPSYVRPTKENPECQQPKHRACHGVAYKKYFAPTDRQCSCYKIDFGGTTYIYMDFWADEEKSIDYPLPAGYQVKNTELSGDLQWIVNKTALTVSGKRGYAVFTGCLD